MTHKGIGNLINHNITQSTLPLLGGTRPCGQTLPCLSDEAAQKPNIPDSPRKWPVNWAETPASRVAACKAQNDSPHRWAVAVVSPHYPTATAGSNFTTTAISVFASGVPRRSEPTILAWDCYGVKPYFSGGHHHAANISHPHRASSTDCCRSKSDSPVSSRFACS